MSENQYILLKELAKKLKKEAKNKRRFIKLKRILKDGMVSQEGKK